ncbi:MAG: glycosyltransferase family 4 protein [Deltaproteobacteria bacterium]|nr:glycosyltransferase family 4 protein [Deltaproteobacteria bacterium]
MNKKVLFLIQDEKMPSSRVRVVNLLPELKKQGIQTETTKYPKKSLDKMRMLKECRQFDIVYVQKKLPSPFDVIGLKIFSRKLFFDFDDAIYYRHDLSESLISRTRYIKFKYIVKNADIVIAGNRILSEYASQFNKNVVVIPSSVEIRDVPSKDHEVSHDKIVIGWVGGEVNLHHLSELAPVFQKLSQEFKIQIRILSSKKIDIPSVEVLHIPWRLETQEKEIAFFDIGVMPLPGNKHAEGKCGYKALQYMAAGVPPIVSDVGINKEIVEHGKEGFVAPTKDEFYNFLKILILNKDLRKKMGYHSRQKVENYFSIPLAGKMLADTLRSC